MASAVQAQNTDINYEELLCVDGKGWNINLFENNNIELYLCKSCSNICRDAAELGCEHNDELIDCYCHQCLDLLIKSNNNTCPLTKHSNPIIQSNRSTRKQILKFQVRCPNADGLANDVDDNVIYDTMDEKEGGKIKSNNSSTKCQWKGTLSDLIKIHIQQCKHHDTDKLKIKSLTKQILSMQHLCNEQNENIAALQTDNNKNKNDIIELKQQMLAFTTTISDQSKLINSFNDKLIQQNEKINKLEQIIAKKEESKQNENDIDIDGKISYHGVFKTGNVSKKFTINNQYQITSKNHDRMAAKLDKPMPANTNLQHIYYWKIQQTGKGTNGPNDCCNHMIGVVSDKCVNFETCCNENLVDSYGITGYSKYVCKGQNQTVTDNNYVDTYKSGDIVYVEYNCKLSKLTFSRCNTKQDMKKLYEINLPTHGVTYWYPAVTMYYNNTTCKFIHS